MVPGLKFSATTSAVAQRRRAVSAPCALCRSMPMLFLLRLNIGKKPAPAPSSRRVRSPSIGSILMTSAPMSASTMPQVGPITMWVNSMTRRPVEGLRCGVVGWVHGIKPLPSRATSSWAGRHATACRAGFRLPAIGPPCARSASSRSKSWPVSMPMLASMYARSSVATLPLAPGACGQPPMPPRQASKRVMPNCERCVDVGQAQAARVVEVAAVELVAGHRQAQLEQLPHHRRVGVAHRVGQAHAVDAGVEHGLHQAHALRRARRGPGWCSRRRC